MAVGVHVYRRTIERRTAASIKAKGRKRRRNRTNVMQEKDNVASDTSLRHLWLINYAWRANHHEHACFRLITSGSFPSRSGIHIYVCRSTALTFSVAIHFAMKRPTPCSAVLRHSPSSWAAVSRPLVGIDIENSEVVHETPHLLFFLAPHAARALHHFSEHYALRQYHALHVRQKSRERDSPPAHDRLDALASCLDKRVQIGNRVVGAVVLSPIDAASQEASVGSAQNWKFSFLFSAESSLGDILAHEFYEILEQL